MKNILITPEGIKTNLKNVKPLEAICEYIWNGFDAGASQIKVYLHTNELGLINMVSVIDNGTGIVYHELPYKFQPFNESKKAGQSSRSNHSLPHGRKGIGRLTFFSFAQMARWDTVYEKGGKKYQYYIDMNKDWFQISRKATIFVRIFHLPHYPVHTGCNSLNMGFIVISSHSQHFSANHNLHH